MSFFFRRETTLFVFRLHYIYNDGAVSIQDKSVQFWQKHNDKASDAKAGVRSYYFWSVLHFCLLCLCYISYCQYVELYGL